MRLLKICRVLGIGADSDGTRLAVVGSWHLALALCFGVTVGLIVDRGHAEELSPEQQFQKISATLAISGLPNDPSYGYTPDNPILLGGLLNREAQVRIAVYFRLVRSVEGRPFEWQRIGNCCPFDTPVSTQGGLIDIYRLTVPEQRPFRVYVNHYDEGQLFAPVGTTFHVRLDQADTVEKALESFAAKEFERATYALTPLAEDGSMIAKFFSGIANLARGRREDAFERFLAAAEAGHPKAQWLVSLSYEQGAGVPPNPAQANRWMRRAAANRYAEARERLAYDLTTGRNVEKDPQEAALWSRLAGEQGRMVAQVAYGMALIQGLGVDRDVDTGLAWLAMAKSGGDEQATVIYQRLTKNAPAETLERIETRAAAWRDRDQASEVAIWQKHSADEGDPAALVQYGRTVLNGVLVPRDVEAGLMYFLLAAQRGSSDARRMYERVTADQPPALLERVERAAEAWSPR